ncbi:uncharacterized protein LOC111606681 [Xiphophorus maculatus]|uniref:uncharacterized protein LOC111606681 n=1 Tax=Xiphophorus maculatus TaxID=8083 RepID=UPI000C6D95F0|nr:uncharacterized protein LOC111606681 [Xiphophorus maculatus]
MRPIQDSSPNPQILTLHSRFPTTHPKLLFQSGLLKIQPEQLSPADVSNPPAPPGGMFEDTRPKTCSLLTKLMGFEQVCCSCLVRKRGLATESSLKASLHPADKVCCHPSVLCCRMDQRQTGKSWKECWRRQTRWSKPAGMQAYYLPQSRQLDRETDRLALLTGRTGRPRFGRHGNTVVIYEGDTAVLLRSKLCHMFYCCQWKDPPPLFR